jgi:zinc/manganese transport system substrate-binding protein
MKSKLVYMLMFAVLAIAMPAHAAKIRVVTTLTDLADFTRNIGGDLVEVRSLATGVEDTHGVPMKPSFVPVLNRADLVVLVGFDCEHAFLPALLEASKNPRIQSGKPGYVDCSQGIAPSEVPKSTDHSEGDVHPYGNPHYMLDPVLAKTAIQNIYQALVATDPEHATLTSPSSTPKSPSGRKRPSPSRERNSFPTTGTGSISRSVSG